MRCVHTGADPLLAGHLHELLSQAGLSPQLRNAGLLGGAGELPPTELWPEIWVPAEEAERAAALLQEQLGRADEPAWQCAACGERLEGQFRQCWRCGHWRT
ncbi:putative signal transducing protein [Alkalilimnicola sp. S0819]|uniref:putative signal transducing protein n=1 Tax=Alkalilimnicola sp. S0819 TaxID=2613922 RepID=UPI0012622BE0|nr:DUF2007 domain-containing protein [Alkalilimnicola sp. S0819]KAB7628316.1 DUF2007 domain-containing protein [Alkalilimnicola sp. S0819]MPQ15214.1 DUF2007 domain-containing protein [Alkalilimnicola sp. S0819]